MTNHLVPMAFLFFHKLFWDDTKHDLIRLVEKVANGMVQLNKINYSLLVLIPKKDTPFSIVDYTSVTLLNSSFKIMSKMLANQLVHILRDLLSDYQSGFIAKRLILEGISLAQEVEHMD